MCENNCGGKGTTFGWNSENQNLAPDNVYIDISEEIAIADDTNGLIDMVAAKLLAADISASIHFFHFDTPELSLVREFWRGHHKEYCLRRSIGRISDGNTIDHPGDLGSQRRGDVGGK